MEPTTTTITQQSPFFLRQVVVRLIRPGERRRWEELMRRRHYLGFKGMVGESLRCVAECGGQWLALLGWQAAALDQVLGQWIFRQSDPDNDIAVDGKTVRGARREDGTQVHLLSDFLHKQGVTIAQREVVQKTNEIPEITPLLEPLELEGRVVTMDALNAQRKTARYVVETKRGDYVFTVKGNQRTLLKDIEALHEEAFSPGARNSG